MTKTTVASVGQTSKSVRTVIPMWIAELMGLEKGAKITWELIRNLKTATPHNSKVMNNDEFYTTATTTNTR